MIEYADKELGVINPAPEVKKWTYQNANEVKRVVNSHESVLYNITCDFIDANGESNAILKIVQPFSYEIVDAIVLNGSASNIELDVNGVPYTSGMIMSGDLLEVKVTTPVDYIVNLKFNK